MAELMKDLAEAHRASLRGDALVPEIARRLAAGAGRRRRSRALGLRLAVAGAAVAAVVAVGRAPQDRSEAPQALAFTIGASAGTGRVGDELHGATADAEAEATFSDGSRVRIAPRGRARVDAVDAQGASLSLATGTLDARIVHRPQTHWRVRAGGYTIQVVGTRFAATWSPETRALNVRLFEGAVDVTGPGLPTTRVAAGQRLEITGGAGRVVADAAVAPATEAAPALAPVVEAPVRRGGHERWRALAAGGRYKEALGALGEGFDAQCERIDGADVVWLGDVARLAGESARAAQAYQAARRRFPRLERATFALGLLAFDARHDYADAADWFGRYLAEAPRGPLAAEASGRLLESLHRAGDTAHEGEAARAYLRAYPSGAQASLARQVLAR